MVWHFTRPTSHITDLTRFFCLKRKKKKKEKKKILPTTYVYLCTPFFWNGRNFSEQQYSKNFPPAASCQIVKHIPPDKYGVKWRVKRKALNVEHFRWSAIIETYGVAWSFRTKGGCYIYAMIFMHVYDDNTCLELSKNVSGDSALFVSRCCFSSIRDNSYQRQ